MFFGAIWFYFCLPNPLFQETYSTIIEDRNNELLGAQIATDGQWRFPQMDSLPPYFIVALTSFEDERFFMHKGVDFFSVCRAFIQNLKAKKIVSGASTLSMQVIRLSRGNKARTIPEKLIEMIMAIRLEMKCSKEEILNLWASHAPYGGNVVGLEAASWRYFHKGPELLTLSEAAMIAVLPNAPSLIHLSRNRNRLQLKRNRLLKKLMDKGFLNQMDYELAILEPLPKAPHPLPSFAPHALQYLKKQQPNIHRLSSNIDLDIQKQCNEIASFHNDIYQQEDIYNLGILVIDNQSGKVVAYIGNAEHAKQEMHVDMVHANRSSGSILKPFLYAHMLESGMILSQSLVKDIPTQIQGFKPKNYNRKFVGAIPADEALAKSLNVPAINMLQEFGVEKFIDKLNGVGLHTINQSADHYGLSLILGGAEVNLWEICGAYSALARTLTRYTNEGEKYFEGDIHKPLLYGERRQSMHSYFPKELSAGSIFLMYKAMEKVQRPDDEGDWQTLGSNQGISWKTGTSFGHRDAWSIGVTPNYTVGIWIGNSDGEGRTNLVGSIKAAPVMFDVFNVLGKQESFRVPLNSLTEQTVCKTSGNILGPHCKASKKTYMSNTENVHPICLYHKSIWLNEAGEQVRKNCVDQDDVQKLAWFVLPPKLAHYYEKIHPEYEEEPPFSQSCKVNYEQNISPLAFIYPLDHSDIYLPIDIDGVREKLICTATHSKANATIYWHFNDTYLGATNEFHSMEINAHAGSHKVSIEDQWGNRSVRRFTVNEQSLVIN